MSSEPILIPIRLERPGFEAFIGPWFCPGEPSLLVDVGPAVGAPALLAALAEMNITRLDYVLLTHVHIDHAGALAQIMNRYPEARAVCFADAVRHVVDPRRLWEGSRQVLGDLGEYYGEPGGVPEESVLPHDKADIPGLTVIETPGHAPHHLSFTWQGRLFSGEAAGNYLNTGNREYVRPATPPRFFLDEAVASVDRLLVLDDQPIHFGHYGWADSSRRIAGRFRAQLFRWRDIVGAELSRGEGPDLPERCLKALIGQDPELSVFPSLPQPVQARERRFILTSVKGYLGFLRESR